MKNDIVIENHGSIFLLRPISKSGREWLDQNIGDQNGFQPYWPTVVVEPRYIADVVNGIRGDNLEVSQ
jgi:hypothetical protein